MAANKKQWFFLFFYFYLCGVGVGCVCVLCIELSLYLPSFKAQGLQMCKNVTVVDILI